jgi:hypothetical protein
MTQLSSLIERLERCEGADREIDLAIFMATAEMESFSVWRPNDPTLFFTASIDAALALVERKLPGWGWQVHRDPQPGLEACFGFVGEPGADGVCGRAYAPSPAIALCLALCRATEGEKT